MRVSRSIFTFAAVLGLLASACHHHHDGTGVQSEERRDQPFVDAIYQRAQFDLGCAPGQFNLFDIGASSYGVVGCGKRASYTCLCMYHVWTTCTQPLCQMNGAPISDPNAVVTTGAGVALTPGAPPPPPPRPAH